MHRIFTSLLVLFFAFTNPAYSQEVKDIRDSEVRGIYLTVKDFKNNTLICNKDTQQKNIKVKLKQFFISPEISCIDLDKETIFYKDSIFAIHLSDDKNFRFLNRNPFLIADTLFLFIYTHETIVTEYIQSGSTRRAKKTPTTYYYFSADTHKNTYPLTLVNLCKNLHLDPQTQASLNQKFIQDEMLYSINPKTGHFLLNEFLHDITIKKQ